MRVAPVVPLKNISTSTPQIILRHDVDFCVRRAYEMFLFERDVGVRSTYFFLSSSYSYNVLEYENRKMIQAIAKGGCEIGLHFDPKIYADMNNNQLYEKCCFEASIISEAANVKVKSVSLHNPTSHGNYVLFRNMNNAYDSDIFSDDCYISDSCMDFRGKNIMEFLDRAQDRSIQVLIHPMHWSESHFSYFAIFDRYISQMRRKIHKEYMQHNWTYREQYLRDNQQP